MKKAIALLKSLVKKDSLSNSITIDNNVIQTSNGVITSNSSCPDTGITATVAGDRLVKAVEACTTPTFKLNNSSVTVKDGAFKSIVPLVDDITLQSLDGKEIKIDGTLLVGSLKKIAPFCQKKNGTTWQESINIVDGFAYAADTIYIVKVPSIKNIDVTIPSVAVAEILKRSDAPVSIINDTHWIGVKWSDNDWIQCSKLEAQWPDTISSLLYDADMEFFTSETKDAIKQLSNIAGDAPLQFTGDTLTTTGEHPSSVDGINVPLSAFNAKILNAVVEHCDSYNVDGYTESKPCRFDGEGFTAAIAGYVIGE